MIERAITLLETTPWPTWEDDTPVRRELETLREDVKRYQIAAGWNEELARKRAAETLERADRISAFIAGRRCRGDEGYFRRFLT